MVGKPPPPPPSPLDLQPAGAAALLPCLSGQSACEIPHRSVCENIKIPPTCLPAQVLPSSPLQQVPSPFSDVGSYSSSAAAALLPNSASPPGGSGFPCTLTDLARFEASLRRNRVACIGAGYVGGPTMAVLAQKCPDIRVTVADVSEQRIQQWNANKLPIYEPGLNEVVSECRGRNLFFTTDIASTVRDSDIIFLAVNTPTKTFGVGKGKAADLASWEMASRSVAMYSESCKIVIEKSTVPVRTARGLHRILEANSGHDDIKFAILSNPEFLAEGSAIADLLKPDRVLIGGWEENPVGEFAIKVLVEIYRRWVPEEKILRTSVWSSELAKLVANAFLAQRVASINTIAMLCEKTDADVRQVSRAVGADTRIGRKYLNASVGFGGSCLQKDVLSLAYLCDYYGLHEAARYWQMVKDMNDLQKSRFANRIIQELFNTVRDKKIAVFGFSFKKNTADTRASPAVDICSALMGDGAIVHVYDPRVEEATARREFTQCGIRVGKTFSLDKQFFMEATPEAAVRNSHAIVILTEWDEFITYNYEAFFRLMLKPAFIFDGRNILPHSALADIGFEVHGVGVPNRYPSSAWCDQDSAELHSSKAQHVHDACDCCS